MSVNGFNKENVQGEFMTSTPGRKPLSTLQMVAENTVSDGTPSAVFSKTPKRSSSDELRIGILTPNLKTTRHSRRGEKRKSVPSRLSKSYSTFGKDMLTRTAGTPTNVSDRLLDIQDSSGETSQALNEMLREKVFETVSKMKEKYEVCLAEKEKHLNEQRDTIAHLKEEVNTLKQNLGEHENEDKDTQECNFIDNPVSLFVEQLLTQVVAELEHENCIQNSIQKPLGTVATETPMTPTKHCDTATSVTPIKHCHYGTSMTPVNYADQGMSTNPLRQADMATTMTPVQHINIETAMSPVKLENSETQMSPVQHVDIETAMSPVKLENSEYQMMPVRHVNIGTAMSPVKLENCETQTISPQHKELSMTPIQQCDASTVMSTVTHFSLLDSQRSNADQLCMTASLDLIAQQDHSHGCQTTPVREHSTSFQPITGQTSNTGTIARTPTEHVDVHTMITPVQMDSMAIGTSPLVAALQPEMIRSLPPEILRAELESLAISNELLRCECDDLNGKLEDLESLLTEARGSADEKCSVLQEKVDSLQEKLDKALEINHQMELQKPHSVEEYENIICKLHKDLLMKEKQIAFFSKKATEADNLQKDLRRMYAKYNTEHQSYTVLDQQMKDLVERHNKKCNEYELMEENICNLRTELDQAKETINMQNKVTEEAKENQFKCHLLEEQMEAFQSQQKENADFIEQERRGLEETAEELEQLIKDRTAELEATRQALDMKIEQCEQLRETVYSLRTQLGDMQDELNAIQSQAHLFMLEQEKELLTVSRVFEEVWERIVTMVDSYKKHAKQDQVSEVGNDPLVKNEVDPSTKPSLVSQVLAAVSGTSVPTDPRHEEVAEEGIEKEHDISFVGTTAGVYDYNASDLTLVDRAMHFNHLVLELEEYASLEAVNEKSQMTIQQHVDEIANLKNMMEEIKVEYEQKMGSLRESLENEQCQVKKIQRENETKEQEIERLGQELLSVEQNFQTTRKHTDEMAERYCQLIEEETKNKELVENMRIMQREFEKTRREKACLEKELEETMERLHSTLTINEEEEDKEIRKNKVQQNFTELLGKKMKLQREVEKLRNTCAKSSVEQERCSQYIARLETKANLLANNLIKAEEELYRLDGIVDRFCSVAKGNRQMAVQSQELCDLLGELNVTI